MAPPRTYITHHQFPWDSPAGTVPVTAFLKEFLVLTISKRPPPRTYFTHHKFLKDTAPAMDLLMELLGLVGQGTAASPHTYVTQHNFL
jgi:hypothetical protein